MPELPEVETIAKGLRQTIVGKKVKEVQAIFPGIVKQNVDLFKKVVVQRKIKGVRRRAKYLLMDLSGGKTILVHLGMTGNLLFTHKSGNRSAGQIDSHDKHDHLIFRFCGSPSLLCYNDQRKFGKIKVFDTSDEKNIPELRKLGPEALEVTVSGFASILRRRKGRIKSVLLNQQVIAGLGNIYADESLFEAKIHPTRKADELSEIELARLRKAVRGILQKAIRAGGSSVDNYLNIDGRMGEFQLQHKVYGREGERCKRCGAKIKRIKINQRSSYFCPRCQPL
ncbi:MAG: bifunctional DNA-formamidopyrimidine glycosylase/DNA-(apurinic or apyrimidinic site) lyase [Candidatus Zixiibacteriota bacterium]